MHLLVTGGTGFIGGHAVNSLSPRPWRGLNCGTGPAYPGVYLIR